MTAAERAYVTTVQQAFRLIQREEDGSPAPLAASVIHRDLTRGEAVIGTSRAHELHASEAAAWLRRTGRNPWTGRRVASTASA